MNPSSVLTISRKSHLTKAKNNNFTNTDRLRKRKFTVEKENQIINIAIMFEVKFELLM